MQPAAAAFVAAHLAAVDDLLDELVLTGGASIGLWLDRPTARPARPTNDVDLVALIGTLPEYYAFGERLRQRGLNEDSSSSVLCRWRDEHAASLDLGNDLQLGRCFMS